MTRFTMSNRNLTMQIDSTRVSPGSCRPSILCYQRLLWSRQIANSYCRYRCARASHDKEDVSAIGRAALAYLTVAANVRSSKFLSSGMGTLRANTTGRNPEVN
jgi:hypothetical protein